ncbi:MAG: hypothetical protein AAF267_04800 [Deinococcota bacterium]
MPIGVFFLLLIGLISLGVWAIGSGLKRSREAAAGKSKLSAQALSALAEPYRGIMYEALSCLHDIHSQLDNVSPSLRRNLADMAIRVEGILERALPRARHGSQLVAYLQRLSRNQNASSNITDDEAKAKLRQQANDIETELRDLLAQLVTLRHKSYQVLGDAARIDIGASNARELQDVMFELDALEDVYAALPSLDDVQLGRPATGREARAVTSKHSSS